VLDLVVDHETTPRTSDITADAPDTAKKGNAKLKGAITDIGGILASALSPEQKTPLQFAPMQRQEFMPIADPRFLKYAGGRKKGGSVPVGSYVKVHDDEKVLNLGDGDVEVVPKGDEPKIQTLGGTIEVPIEETQESFKPPQKEDTSHSMGTPQEMEEPVKQSIADTLRGRIEEIQGRGSGRATCPSERISCGRSSRSSRNSGQPIKRARTGS
jgi:acylphosphatase